MRKDKTTIANKKRIYFSETEPEKKLIPLESLDLSKIHDFDELLRAMEFTSFGGRRLGESAETLFRMVTDKDAFIVLTLSGAMTVAKMGLIICEMIDRGFVHAVISTGALMTHGLVESVGMTHFKCDPHITDVGLFKKGYNRVYDTLEAEENLDRLEKIFFKVIGALSPEEILSSRAITWHLGKWLSENVKERGILKSAYEMGIPVYIPAFTDSELGLDFAILNKKLVKTGKKALNFDAFLDLEHYTELVNRQKKLGIFSIGGGVPRNWGQQVAPYLDLLQRGLFSETPIGSSERQCEKRMSYGLRICPDAVEWGGLSGCTYSEGVSWGKFLEKEAGGRYSEVLADATMVWPLLIKGVIQRLEKGKIKVTKNFNLIREVKMVDRLTKIL